MFNKITQKLLLLCLFIATLFSANAYCQPVMTASGNANGYVLRAVQQNNIIKIDLRFEALVDGYSGETIYTQPSTESWQKDFYIEINGTHYPLKTDSDGKYQAPEDLKLTFCYNTAKNPRVGSWHGEFTAPETPVETISLALPNLPVITDIQIK